MGECSTKNLNAASENARQSKRQVTDTCLYAFDHQKIKAPLRRGLICLSTLKPSSGQPSTMSSIDKVNKAPPKRAQDVYTFFWVRSQFLPHDACYQYCAYCNESPEDQSVIVVHGVPLLLEPIKMREPHTP